jgi:hypothetical protein
MGKAVRLAVLGVVAFAATYLLFRYGSGFLANFQQPSESPGMVWIPGGTFWRGSDNPKMRDAQVPARPAVPRRDSKRQAGHEFLHSFPGRKAHRLKGELHLVESNDQAAAEGCFRTAIETARRQQGKAWELRATPSLARLWQRQGRHDDARAALAAVYGTYTEGFTTPDLVDAAALLKALA